MIAYAQEAFRFMTADQISKLSVPQSIVGFHDYVINLFLHSECREGWPPEPDRSALRPLFVAKYPQIQCT